MSDAMNTVANARYFSVGGHPHIQSDPDTGSYTAAVVDDSGQVVVTFEGTSLDSGNGGFTVGQPAADAPHPALDLTQTGLADAEAAGYSSRDIVLTTAPAGMPVSQQATTQAAQPGGLGDSPQLAFIGGSGSVSIMGDGGAVTLYGAIGGSSDIHVQGGGSSAAPIYENAGATTVTAGFGASTIAGGDGPGLMLGQGDDTDAMSVGSGAASLLAGSGASSALGSNVYGFVGGHTDGDAVMQSLAANDTPTLGGPPIDSEGASHGASLITLSNGTVVVLSGIDRNIFG